MVDEGIRLLMRDVTEAILPKIRDQGDKELDPIANDLCLPGMDVERLITLFENSGVLVHARLARALRRLFHDELQARLAKLPRQFEPDLLGALFDYHNVKENPEELQAVLTLNYDSLAEDALLRSHGGYDHVIKSLPEGTREGSTQGVPVLKLHGSFDWRKDYPTRVMERGSKAEEDDLLWIPPGVEKRRERYPFSLLWARAQELLDCNTLRVVGCSLSANDWHLVTLLFATQRAPSNMPGYAIELIDFPGPCEEVKSRYRYLQIVGIMDQPGFVRSVAEDLFPKLASGGDPSDEEKREVSGYLDGQRVNILERWLRDRGENLRFEGSELETRSGIFKRFVDGGEPG